LQNFQNKEKSYTEATEDGALRARSVSEVSEGVVVLAETRED
jgi:hypothetical protein